MRVLIGTELERGGGFELALWEGALAVSCGGQLNAHGGGIRGIQGLSRGNLDLAELFDKVDASG